MTHDDATLGAFVAGELSPAEAERVDAHVLGCDECWEAVRQDLHGGRLARSLRVRAPAGLADRVEAAVRARASPPRGARRRQLIAGLVAVACATVLLAGVSRWRDRPDPPLIATIVRLASASAPAETLAGQRLPGNVAVSYERVDGQIVILATERRPFPMPLGAHPTVAGTTDPWVARRGPLTLLCVNGAHPALLVGPVPAADLLGLARGLGLG